MKLSEQAFFQDGKLIIKQTHDFNPTLEAAKNLQLSDVTVSTLEVDLLDVEGMAEKLGVPAEKE